MSSSVLYGVNSNSQTFVSGSTINFGSVVRKYGCNCSLSGGNVEVTGNGYYNIDSNVTVTANTAGIAIITLYKDGIQIPGATSSFTATAGDVYSVTIPTVVRQKCCCSATVTAVITGISGTITNAAILVVKE